MHAVKSSQTAVLLLPSSHDSSSFLHYAMTDSCATWRNQTSHSGFTGCKCDGKDITGRSAHQDCAETAALMAFIIGPPILIVALICYTREAQERLETFLIRCLEDTVICHPRIQPLRFAIKWTRPSAPIAQHPILPRELCDIIIGFCEEDQSLLLSCILVCVAWVSPSRKRLKMELRCKSYKHIVELTHLLRSPVETLSPWVHCTGINFGGKFYHQQWRLLCLLKLKGVHPQRATIWRRIFFASTQISRA